MNWRKAKELREHLIFKAFEDNRMSTEEDRDRERSAFDQAEIALADHLKKPFEQMPRQPLEDKYDQQPKRHLTIIWEEERKALFGRIEALEVDVRFLRADIKTILHAQSRYLSQQEERGVFGTGRIPEADYEGPRESQRPLK